MTLSELAHSDLVQPTYGQDMNQAAQRWRDLAERRRAHFVELFESGRWRHYYTPRAFFAALREAAEAADRWNELAPPPRPVHEAPRQMTAA